MRNLVLSAFPRAMRLPDPFTPNLKVDLLPEIASPPRFVPAPDALLPPALRGEVDSYLAGRGGPGGAPPASFLLTLRPRLTLGPADALVCGTKYNVPLINALAFYVGCRAVEEAPPKPGTPPAMDTPHMHLFQHLLRDLDTGGCGRGGVWGGWGWRRGRHADGAGWAARLALASGPARSPHPSRLASPLPPLVPSTHHPSTPTHPHPPPAEGRYLFINALANHLRFPNAHTHYFSCAILTLFTEAGSELVQEQITRVLLERLIVNRWGRAADGGAAGAGAAPAGTRPGRSPPVARLGPHTASPRPASPCPASTPPCLNPPAAGLTPGACSSPSSSSSRTRATASGATPSRGWLPRLSACLRAWPAPARRSWPRGPRCRRWRRDPRGPAPGWNRARQCAGAAAWHVQVPAARVQARALLSGSGWRRRSWACAGAAPCRRQPAAASRAARPATASQRVPACPADWPR